MLLLQRPGFALLHLHLSGRLGLKSVHNHSLVAAHYRRMTSRSGSNRCSLAHSWNHAPVSIGLNSHMRGSKSSTQRLRCWRRWRRTRAGAGRQGSRPLAWRHFVSKTSHVSPRASFRTRAPPHAPPPYDCDCTRDAAGLQVSMRLRCPYGAAFDSRRRRFGGDTCGAPGGKKLSSVLV